jgi:membrane protein DedA with SNARE-associated domain/uncharacterized tellurite resistance protein B-like protein
MEQFVAWLLGLSSETVYAVIGLTTLVENVFPPTPSDLAVALGGFLAQHRRVTLTGIWAVACLANLGGTLVVYFLSRKYGRTFRASRLGRRLLPADAIVTLEREYLRYGLVGIFLGRLLPGFRSVVAPFAGLVNLPVLSSLIPITLATLTWYAFLVWAGARLGAQWESISHFLGQLNRTLAIIAGLLALLIAVVIIRRRKTRPIRRDLLLRAIHRAMGSPLSDEPVPPGQDPAVAGAATLLFELARADHQITPEERESITSYLRERWQLGSAEPPHGPQAPAPELSQTAEVATLISERFDRERRLELVGQLYRIACGDGTLGRHEERLLLRAAALLGLGPDDLAAARNTRRPQS